MSFIEPDRVFLEDDAESDEPDDRSTLWASCAWRQTSMTSIPQSCLANDAKHSSELATSITLKQHQREILTRNVQSCTVCWTKRCQSSASNINHAMLGNNAVLDTIYVCVDQIESEKTQNDAKQQTSSCTHH